MFLNFYHLALNNNQSLTQQTIILSLSAPRHTFYSFFVMDKAFPYKFLKIVCVCIVISITICEWEHNAIVDQILF